MQQTRSGVIPPQGNYMMHQNRQRMPQPAHHTLQQPRAHVPYVPPPPPRQHAPHVVQSAVRHPNQRAPRNQHWSFPMPASIPPVIRQHTPNIGERLSSFAGYPPFATRADNFVDRVLISESTQPMQGIGNVPIYGDQTHLSNSAQIGQAKHQGVRYPAHLPNPPQFELYGKPAVPECTNGFVSDSFQAGPQGQYYSTSVNTSQGQYYPSSQASFNQPPTVVESNLITIHTSNQLRNPSIQSQQAQQQQQMAYYDVTYTIPVENRFEALADVVV